MKKKTKRRPVTSARVLLERVTYQLEELNRRYATLFEIATTPGAMPMHDITNYTHLVTLDRDMKAGETINVRVPQKFTLSR